MDERTWGIFIGLIVALTLVIQSSVAAQQATNDNNKSPSQNNTIGIINLKNHTISLIDTRTNETISVKNLMLNTGNNTTNETIGTQNISGNTGNIITNESKNTNATENAENATENVNLTEKFNALSK